MLKLDLVGEELFNEDTWEYISVEPVTVRLEHSLLAISRWESKYHKPFMSTPEKTLDELAYYVRCMTLTDDLLDDEIAMRIVSSQDTLRQVKIYLDDPATATVVKADPGAKKSSKFVTSELIYYWMAAHRIPFTTDRWNINRLLKLIEVCNAESQPSKKMSYEDKMRNHKSINAARRAKRKH